MKVSIGKLIASQDRRESYFAQYILPNGKKIKQFHAPSVELIFNLLLTSDVLTSHFVRTLSKHNLSLSAFNILGILTRVQNDGLALSELSEFLIVSRANITGLVDCLEQRGLVERVAQTTDRRMRLAKITPAGEALVRSVLPTHYEEINAVCGGLNNEERATLIKLLTKLRRSHQTSQSISPKSVAARGSKK